MGEANLTANAAPDFPEYISHYFTNIVKTVRRAKFVRAVGVYFLFHNEGCKRSGSRIYANLPESHSVFSYKYTE